MNLLDRMIAPFAPAAALRRVQARLALNAVKAHYDAASVSPRTGHRRAPGTDADAASSRRARIAFVARDMVRNTPFAARAQQVIANNVVGDGILPKVRIPRGLTATRRKKLQERLLELIERDLDTTSIDADGRQTIYGLQRLVMNTVVDSGEALVLRVSGRHQRLKVRVLEPDYIDTTRHQSLTNGGWVREGIEYDQSGARVAYYLFDTHPGSDNLAGSWSPVSRRIPAKDVLHIFRQDRPGQMRGVSWFAPIAINLADLDEFQDAQLMRQKISACFVAFRTVDTDGAATAAQADAKRPLEELRPGLVQDIGSDETVTFGNPPDSGDFDPFARAILRSAASGLGLTYESLTGDLSSVNFSSARMGRVEMDRNVSSWQWTMLIPGMLQPMGRWIIESWMADLTEFAPALLALLQMDDPMDWVPPHKVLVDPTREIPALIESIRGGLASRPGVVRSLGHDPERLDEEIAQDNARMDELGLRFESDYRHAKTASAGAGRVVEPDEEAGRRRPSDEATSARQSRGFKGF